MRKGVIPVAIIAVLAPAGGAYAQTAAPVEEAPLTPCQEMLNSPELQNVKSYIDENGAAVRDLYNRRLSGLDCTFEEIKKYLLDLDFDDYRENIGTNHSGMAVRYRPKTILYYVPIIGGFYQGYNGAFIFDKDNKFDKSSWSVAK